MRFWPKNNKLLTTEGVVFTMINHGVCLKEKKLYISYPFLLLKDERAIRKRLFLDSEVGHLLGWGVGRTFHGETVFTSTTACLKY